MSDTAVPTPKRATYAGPLKLSVRLEMSDGSLLAVALDDARLTGLAIGDYAPADPTGPGQPSAPTQVITYKADVWRRCNDDEAAQVDGALSQAPVRLRRLWDDSSYLDHSAPEFAELRAPMVEAFGQARADEILAPSEA